MTTESLQIPRGKHKVLNPWAVGIMYRIKLQHKALSPEVIRNALIHVQHSVFKHKRTQKRYVMPAQINPEAKKIYAVMGLKATTTAYPLY